ncbi:hypothetical protein GLF_1786 [Gluconobacter frateurii NBRC 101659]|nr:hypothetical protein GLF_1786 [Gluconobacter frateurii NBRC 101659]
MTNNSLINDDTKEKEENIDSHKEIDSTEIVDATIENIEKYSKILLHKIFMFSSIEEIENERSLIFRLGESKKKSVIYSLSISKTMSVIFSKIRLSMLVKTKITKERELILETINELNKKSDAVISINNEGVISFESTNIIKSRIEIRELISIFTIMTNDMSESNILFLEKSW